MSEKIGQLKIKSPDAKFYKTDVADTEQLFKLIQSIPSQKIAKQGDNIAKVAKLELEAKTGKKITTSINAGAALEKNKRNNENYTKFNTTITVSPTGHYCTHS